MSRANIEALMKALAAPVEDPADFYALLDEDIVWDPGPQFPSGRVYGHKGVLDFFRRWIGTFDDFGWEAREYIDGGGSVFVHMHQWGRGKGSGITTEIDLWQVWLFFEGKVVRFVMKPSRREALEAAGLQE